MTHNINITDLLDFAKHAESVFFSEKNIKNLFTKSTWRHLEESILFIEKPEYMPAFFKQLPSEILASDIERLTAFWRVFTKDGFVTYEDISAFSGASIPTLKRMVQSGKLKKINRVSRPAKIEFKSALSYFFSEELPEDPHERETQILWRMLLTPRSEWPDHLPKVRAKNRAQLISKMFLPAYVPQPDSFNGLMRFFSTSEIAFIQAVLIAQRNNDKIWENRISSEAGQAYQNIMKYIKIYCDRHPDERYQIIMDLLFPKVFECPECRCIGTFKRDDWTQAGGDFNIENTSDDDNLKEKGKKKREPWMQRVHVLFCENCKTDYNVKDSDIKEKFITSKNNANLLNNTCFQKEKYILENFIYEFKTDEYDKALNYYGSQQRTEKKKKLDRNREKRRKYKYGVASIFEIGEAAGGVRPGSIHAPIKKLYSNPLFMKVWELSENIKSQFNPHNPFPIHPLVRFLFPETFKYGIAALCDRELLSETISPVSPATPLSVPIESYPLPY
jgi:uncharacterized protein YerC